MSVRSHMKLTPIFAIVLTLLVSACATAPRSPVVDFNPEYNFSSVKTYGFTYSDNIDHTTLDGSRIEKAIEQEMAIKGLKKVDQKPDILIRFSFTREDKQKIVSFDQHFSHRLWYGGYPFYDNNMDVLDYTEAKLIIEAINPKTQRSVWQAEKTRVERETNSPIEREAQLQVMVSFLLSALPAPSI